jgi:hypothetical protein
MAGSVAAQDAGRATVEQLSQPASGRVMAPPTASAPVDPDVAQLAADTPRRVVATARTSTEARRPATVLPGEATRNIRMTAPPAEAVDRCEAVSAGRAPPLEGVDCSAVLEAAAFARRSPEERLLAAEDSLAATDQRQTTVGQAIPNAALVAERLATGNVMGSAAAQAIASQPGAASQQAAPTVINVTNPDGTTGTIVVPPNQP